MIYGNKNNGYGNIPQAEDVQEEIKTEKVELSRNPDGKKIINMQEFVTNVSSLNYANDILFEPYGEISDGMFLNDSGTKNGLGKMYLKYKKVVDEIETKKQELQLTIDRLEDNINAVKDNIMGYNALKYFFYGSVIRIKNATSWGRYRDGKHGREFAQNYKSIVNYIDNKGFVLLETLFRVDNGFYKHKHYYQYITDVRKNYDEHLKENHPIKYRLGSKTINSDFARTWLGENWDLDLIIYTYNNHMRLIFVPNIIEPTDKYPNPYFKKEISHVPDSKELYDILAGNAEKKTMTITSGCSIDDELLSIRNYLDLKNSEDDGYIEGKKDIKTIKEETKKYEEIIKAINNLLKNKKNKDTKKTEKYFSKDFVETINELKNKKDLTKLEKYLYEQVQDLYSRITSNYMDSIEVVDIMNDNIKDYNIFTKDNVEKKEEKGLLNKIKNISKNDSLDRVKKSINLITNNYSKTVERIGKEFGKMDEKYLNLLENNKSNFENFQEHITKEFTAFKKEYDSKIGTKLAGELGEKDKKTYKSILKDILGENGQSFDSIVSNDNISSDNIKKFYKKDIQDFCNEVNNFIKVYIEYLKENNRTEEHKQIVNKRYSKSLFKKFAKHYLQYSILHRKMGDLEYSDYELSILDNTLNGQYSSFGLSDIASKYLNKFYEIKNHKEIDIPAYAYRPKKTGDSFFENENLKIYRDTTSDSNILDYNTLKLHSKYKLKDDYGEANFIQAYKFRLLIKMFDYFRKKYVGVLNFNKDTTKLAVNLYSSYNDFDYIYKAYNQFYKNIGRRLQMSQKDIDFLKENFTDDAVKKYVKFLHTDSNKNIAMKKEHIPNILLQLDKSIKFLSNNKYNKFNQKPFQKMLVLHNSNILNKNKYGNTPLNINMREDPTRFAYLTFRKGYFGFLAMIFNLYQRFDLYKYQTHGQKESILTKQIFENAKKSQEDISNLFLEILKESAYMSIISKQTFKAFYYINKTLKVNRITKKGHSSLIEVIAERNKEYNNDLYLKKIKTILEK